MPDDEATRTCPGYDREAHTLPVHDFYKDAGRRGGGYSRLCKECHKARGRVAAKAWYEGNKEKQKDAVTARRKAAKD